MYSHSRTKKAKKLFWTIKLIRLGDAADATAAGPSTFDNVLWSKLKPAIGY